MCSLCACLAPLAQTCQVRQTACTILAGRPARKAAWQCTRVDLPQTQTGCEHHSQTRNGCMLQSEVHAGISGHRLAAGSPHFAHRLLSHAALSPATRHTGTRSLPYMNSTPAGSCHVTMHIVRMCGPSSLVTASDNAAYSSSVHRRRTTWVTVAWIMHQRNAPCTRYGQVQTRSNEQCR